MYVAVNSYVLSKSYDKNGRLLSNFTHIGNIYVRNETVILANELQDVSNEYKYLCSTVNGSSFYTDQTGADDLGITTRV